MVFFELLLLVPVALYALYKWLTLGDKVFEERGVPYIKPWPLAGNDLDIVLNKESMVSSLIKFYKKTSEHKVHGYFNFRTPIFVVNDPELIKKIAIKDFDHFPNHANFFPTNGDKLIESMLSIMKDQRWKNMRNTLSPVFTAAKMRTMFSLMNECFAESLDYLHKLPNVNTTGAELELKQCFTRLSNDLIASTAFGLKINSYESTNNEFYNLGQTLTNFRGTQMIKFMMTSLAPKLMQLIGVEVFEKKKTEYFTKLVVEAMKHRQQNNIVRPDMIQLLLEAKKESSEHWSDVELAAQCFIFFFAAFENNANFICTTCHELMLNPDIQQRLYEEAVELRSQLNGKPLGYDDVNKMKYMDMVLSESLRLWSLAAVTDRFCSKDYALKDEDGKVVVNFKVGDRIWFPIAGLLRDEKYFENPEVFDPERFSDENKKSINQGAYIPFGLGPRNCIGNRYALMQAKAMLYHLVLSFKIERSSKTVKNLMDDLTGFQINPKNGFWVKLIARK